jgi:OOP family OmpA-OmpF porin
MRSAAGFTLITVTLGLSSACGAAPERPLAPLPPSSAAATLPPTAAVFPPSAPAFASADSDRDGVPDPYDACPGLPGVLSRVVVLNGCPPPGYYEDGLGSHDRDGDGVLDDADACPEDPGPPQARGCARPPDADGDGVPDGTDVCRNAPGPARDDARVTGCPAAWVEGDRVRILEQVRFASGSAELLAESTAVLEAVVGVLTGRADIAKLRVEGHTDGRGGAVMNRKLSLARAAQVARFLTAHGVLAARLDAEGIGPDRPIDTNETEAGRATNRRVEFHVVGLAPAQDSGQESGLSVGMFPPSDGTLPAAAPEARPAAPQNGQAATLDPSGL